MRTAKPDLPCAGESVFYANSTLKALLRGKLGRDREQVTLSILLLVSYCMRTKVGDTRLQTPHPNISHP